jgi:drug/metabolite transporter (DMT)-like permease
MQWRSWQKAENVPAQAATSDHASGALPVVPSGILSAAFVLLWSTGYPAARIALDHAAPFTLLLMRFAGAGLIFASLARLGDVAWPRGQAALHSASIGVLSLGLQFGALYWAAAQGVNVGLIALVIGTMPIVTALLGREFLGEVVRPLQWLGFAFGFGGVALAVGEGATVGGGDAGGYLAVLVGLFAISIGTLYQKRYGSDVDPRSGLALQNLAAAAVLVPFACFEGFRFDSTPALAASLAWIIGANSLSAFALFFVLLRRGAVSRVATLFFLMPPVTAVTDYFVLGDSLDLLKLSGIVLSALGVYLATRPAAAARDARRKPAAGRPAISTARRADPCSCPARSK